MKIGLSTYSLSSAIIDKEMSVLEAIQWIKDNNGECVEIVPSGFELTGNPELVDAIVTKCKELNLDIASYTIGANFIQETEEEYKKEIERVKREVDIANALGVKFMRHDAGNRPMTENSIENFEKDLPKVADACREIADYANNYGITTSVENHGYHFQGSERVLRLVHLVNRSNFKTTLDIGNFLCVDEDPISAVKNNLLFASMVHMKDFYIRNEIATTEGWFSSSHGRWLRGAVVGCGDIDIPSIIKLIKDFGYNGYISIEFEGWEDCRLGSKTGIQNVKTLWDKA